MKKLINVSAILAVIGLAAMMTGCGGSDHNNNDVVVATPYAPATFANRSVTLTEGGQSRDIQFATSGNTFTQFQQGTTNAVGTGTFQYAKTGDNLSQLILTTTGTDGATVTYTLNFANATSGTYTYVSSTGQSGSGTFSNLQEIAAGGNTGGNDGGNNGGGNNGGGNTGDIPTSLTGRAIDFTASGQGNEKLTFGSGNTVTSDVVQAPNNVGTYTYTAGTATTPGTLVVTFPNGDTYNLTLSFTDSTHGTWNGSQHYDNADHAVPAGSSFTIAQ